MLHRKVQCWIFSEGPEPFRLGASDAMVLLLQTNQARGEFWQPVTGTVEANEGFFEAACREPFEETGFIFNSPPADTGYEFDFVSRVGQTRERVFALTVEDHPNPRIDPKEHQDFQWVPPSQALSLLRFPSNLEGLKRSYRLVFGKDLP